MSRYPPDAAMDRTTFAWCAAAVAASLPPLGRTLPLWLAGLLAALTLLGAGFGWRGRVLSPWIRLPLTLGVAGLVLFQFRFQFGRDTGAALLVTMLALKLLETRRLRDGRSVLSFSFFALMASFLQDQAPLTLGLALIGTVLCLGALARIAERELPAAERPPPAPAIVPRLRRTVGLLSISIPLALVGFFLFPRLASPLWGLPGNVGEARTGLSDDMSPGDISRLYADDSPAFRVVFDGEAPPAAQMYWRGPVLTQFDGRRWARASWASAWPPGRLQGRATPLNYEITLEPTDRRYLVLLDMPVAAPEDAILWFDRTVTTRRAQAQLHRYRGASYLDYELEPDLRIGYRQANLQLPANYNPLTRALVEQWTADAAEPRAVIRRALDLFNAEFSYTLEPQLLGRDSIDDFLFQTREGYCEHFASAFVVMMRMAGIPARVVTGYQGGVLNPLGGYWVVLHSDAHAWAEVWLAGTGWVRVDPTSAVAPQRIDRGTSSLGGEEGFWAGVGEPLFQAADWLRRGWNDLILGFDATRQRRLLLPFGVPEASTTQLGVALAVAVGVALALTLGLLLRAPRGPRDPLRLAYAGFLRRLARAGVGKRPHEGPLDFGDRVAAALPAAAEQVRALSRRYARRRYAADAVDAEADRSLCDALQAFRVPRHAVRRSP